jgi:hypothetical protein
MMRFVGGRCNRAPILDSHDAGASPARLLEMLSDRSGALEAVAYSSIKPSRYVSECDMSMDLLVAEAVLEFGEELRNAQEAAASRKGGEAST